MMSEPKPVPKLGSVLTGAEAMAVGRTRAKLDLGLRINADDAKALVAVIERLAAVVVEMRADRT